LIEAGEVHRKVSDQVFGSFPLWPIFPRTYNYSSFLGVTYIFTKTSFGLKQLQWISISYNLNSELAVNEAKIQTLVFRLTCSTLSSV
jgi:hypothetical protein